MRRFKQIAYGLFYLLIITAIIYGLYLFFVPETGTCLDNVQNRGETGVDCGGPCISCDIKALKPIEVITDFYDIGNGKSSVLIEFKNPNHNYGARVYEYELSFESSTNEILYSENLETIIYPSEVKKIVIPQISLEAGRVLVTGVTERNIEWKPVIEFFKPKSQVREQKIQFVDSDKVLITGILKNDNPFRISRAQVNAVLENESGSIVGLSRTIATSLRAREERFFQVTVIPFAGITEEDVLKAELSIEMFR